jgi:hypothetical protein
LIDWLKSLPAISADIGLDRWQKAWFLPAPLKKIWFDHFREFAWREKFKQLCSLPTSLLPHPISSVR